MHIAHLHSHQKIRYFISLWFPLSQLLIPSNQLRNALAFGHVLHQEPRHLHYRPIILFDGYSTTPGYGDLGIETGETVIRVQDAGIQNGLSDLLFLCVSGRRLAGIIVIPLSPDLGHLLFHFYSSDIMLALAVCRMYSNAKSI